MESINFLERQLDSFDGAERLAALKELKGKVLSGEIKAAPGTGFVNLHCHTFFSFNAYGYSPSKIAWVAYKSGLEAVGSVDFDVLDAVDEFLGAGKILGIRVISGIETRVFVKEYAQKDINSPKEPGVSYFMGMGFYKRPAAYSEEEKTLLKLARVAQKRNREVLAKVNAYLKDITVDYDKDVLPLTPLGNATERHMLEAIDNKARAALRHDEQKLAEFWAGKLELETAKVAEALRQPADLREILRAKLMKQGAPGYVKPEEDHFPGIDEVVKMITGSGALPVLAWLDGTTEVEKDAGAYLDFMMAKGIVAVNIIPDRNYNLKDAQDKAVKVKKLHEIILAAWERHLPLIAGTEMNKSGQKLVDDFAAPELAPCLHYFVDGAYFLNGHTIMGKLFNKGYSDDWANRFLPEHKQKAAFYKAVGKKLLPDFKHEQYEKLGNTDITPDEILEMVISN